LDEAKYSKDHKLDPHIKSTLYTRNIAH